MLILYLLFAVLFLCGAGLLYAGAERIPFDHVRLRYLCIFAGAALLIIAGAGGLINTVALIA